MIYWCGYLKHLEWSTEHGILVRDTFPDSQDIIRLNPLEGAFDQGFDTDPDDDADSSSDDCQEGEANSEAVVRMTNNLKL